MNKIFLFFNFTSYIKFQKNRLRNKKKIKNLEMILNGLDTYYYTWAKTTFAMAPRYLLIDESFQYYSSIFYPF